MPPIYATSTYVQSSPGVHKGYDYGRTHNPTRFAFERCVADLEGGAQAFAFASGPGGDLDRARAARRRLARRLRATTSTAARFRLFDKVRQRSAGLRFSFVDLTDLESLRAALRPDTKLVWVETPTNPLLRLADLRAIAEICRARGIVTRRRQHLRQPLRAAPARARLRHRRALGHQVPERPLRRDRRHRRRRQATPRLHAGARAARASCRTRSARSPARSTASWRCAA